MSWLLLALVLQGAAYKRYGRGLGGWSRARLASSTRPIRLCIHIDSGDLVHKDGTKMANPTKKQKQARARREMRLRDDAPTSLPRCVGEFSDHSVGAVVAAQVGRGNVVATTDPWGDRWNHFHSLVVWAAPAKWVEGV